MVFKLKSPVRGAQITNVRFLRTPDGAFYIFYLMSHGSRCGLKYASPFQGFSVIQREVVEVLAGRLACGFCSASLRSVFCWCAETAFWQRARASSIRLFIHGGMTVYLPNQIGWTGSVSRNASMTRGSNCLPS